MTVVVQCSARLAVLCYYCVSVLRGLYCIYRYRITPHRSTKCTPHR